MLKRGGIFMAVGGAFMVLFLTSSASIPGMPPLDGDELIMFFLLIIGGVFILAVAFNRFGVDQSVPVLPNQAGQSHAEPPIGPAVGKVQITSLPSGAEILVDGKFAGCTPSEVMLVPGEHGVKVGLNGREWSRTLTISRGRITLHADLTEAAVRE
jgi:hypothetical protein